MSKNIFVTSLKTALLVMPLLAGCKTSTPTILIPPGGLTLPDCNEGQLISVGQDKTLGCTQALTTNLSPPSCPVNTHALNAVDGNLLCMPKGTGSTNSDLTAAINNVVTKTTNLQNQINNFGGGSGAAKYCGQYSSTPNVNGRITTTQGLVGLTAAAALCQTVNGCNSSAHMCTPYELFESVSANIIKSTDLIPRSWVYMASWQVSNVAGEQEPTAGLGDNCGSFTYPTHDRKWDGTAVEFAALVSGEHVLKFFTGDSEVLCSATLPIACCN